MIALSFAGVKETTFEQAKKMIRQIILLDEYDTPMQEAYLQGYWEEMVAFIRSLFNTTFKTNPHLGRAVMTGITCISRESMFSDPNNRRW